MPRPQGRGNKRCFCPSVRLSVCPSVAYIATNSRTRRPSVPKVGRKIPHLRCDSHASFKVKRSKVRVRGGRGHTVSAEPGVHIYCFYLRRIHREMQSFNSFAARLHVIDLRLFAQNDTMLLCRTQTSSITYASCVQRANCKTSPLSRRQLTSATQRQGKMRLEPKTI